MCILVIARPIMLFMLLEVTILSLIGALLLLIKIRNHKLYSIQHLPQSDALKRCVQKSFYTPKHFDSATLVTLQHSDITSAWLKLAHAHKQLRINHLQMCEDCEPLQDGNVRLAGMGLQKLVLLMLSLRKY